MGAPDNAIVQPHDLTDPNVSYPIDKPRIDPPQPGTRGTAINRAWRLEQTLVKLTGRGTRSWTQRQLQELQTTGQVRGYTGHHINNVADYPDWTGDPRNIVFLRRGSGQEHVVIGHEGHYTNSSSGNLIDRQAIIDAILANTGG